jgi:4-hydroxy-tetrahydrodipicolinate reductase
MNPIRLAVAGCCGRMGRAVLRLAAADPAFTVAAAVTVPGDAELGRDAGPVAGVGSLGVVVSERCEAACDVLIEFTTPGGTLQWARWCAQRGVALVSGTTGLGEGERAALHEAAARVAVLWAPNMSVGVNLLLRLVEQVARSLDAGWDVEIVEAHHRQKVDAPSGTARALLDAVFAGRGRGAEDAVVYGRSGTPGARRPGEVGLHALRLGGVIGDHDVHFGSMFEVLTLRHRALSRDAFAAGALRAARWLIGRGPGLYGMGDVLGV